MISVRKGYKFILFIFTLFIFISLPKCVNAVLIVPESMIKGKVIVRWVDYDDKMEERPDNLEVEFYDFGNDKYITKTLYEKDAQVQSDPNMTIWTFEVELPAINENIFYNLGTPPEIEGYTFDRMSSGGSINSAGGSINLTFTKHFSKYVTYTEHWDDGGARDSERVFGMWMIPTNNDMLGEDDGFPMSLGCGRDQDTYIDDNTCQTKIYIPYVYPFDENNVPIWDEPTTFEYRKYDTLVDYVYDYVVDSEGNIDVYIKHEPYTIDDSKVEIIWNDNNDKNKKRPDEIILYLYNYDTLEQQIKVNSENWESTITDLYKNYLKGKASNYSLKVFNTEYYEFLVKGNSTDGFKVEAEYIGEDINIDNPDENNEEIINEELKTNEELKINEEQKNPKTNDNIVLYIVILILAGIVIISSIIFLRKKNYK